MAENFVNVTEGSGKKLHTFNRTIGANDVHDEVVVLGEQYLDSYLVDSGIVSVATANDHLLAIQASSSLGFLLRWLKIYQLGLATTAAYGQVQIFRLTTAGTGGSVITPRALDIADSAAVTAMTLPTAKGTEAQRLVDWSHPYTQTISATPGKDTLLADWNFDTLRMGGLKVPSGTANGIAVKHVTAVAAATVIVMAGITEIGF
jgi:hypothetical protein